jgi:hypothetical protein
MLSRADHQAADISGPAEGSIWVLGLTTAASAEQDFASASYFNLATFSPQFVTMKCSVRWYITMKDVTGVTSPDETQTSGAARTWEVAPDEPFPVRVAPGLRQFWKAKGSATANLRIYPSSANNEKGA